MSKVNVLWTIPVLAFQDRPKYVVGAPFYVKIVPGMAQEFGIEGLKAKLKRYIPSAYRIL